jgi:cbb3-type cytochrome oxidase subunit 3
MKCDLCQIILAAAIFTAFFSIYVIAATLIKWRRKKKWSANFDRLAEESATYIALKDAEEFQAKQEREKERQKERKAKLEKEIAECKAFFDDIEYIKFKSKEV